MAGTQFCGEIKSSDNRLSHPDHNGCEDCDENYFDDDDDDDDDNYDHEDIHEDNNDDIDADNDDVMAIMLERIHLQKAHPFYR